MCPNTFSLLSSLQTNMIYSRRKWLCTLVHQERDRCSRDSRTRKLVHRFIYMLIGRCCYWFDRGLGCRNCARRTCSNHWVIRYSSEHKPMNFSQNCDRAQITLATPPLFHFFASISTNTAFHESKASSSCSRPIRRGV